MSRRRCLVENPIILDTDVASLAMPGRLGSAEAHLLHPQLSRDIRYTRAVVTASTIVPMDSTISVIGTGR
jgi:hypothetical protein